MSTVADIDVPQTRKPVDVFAAVGIAQHRALPLDDNQRLAMVIRVVQRVHQKPPVAFEKLRGVVHRVLLFSSHPTSLRRARECPRRCPVPPTMPQIRSQSSAATDTITVAAKRSDAAAEGRAAGILASG